MIQHIFYRIQIVFFFMHTIVDLNSITWCLWCGLWAPSIYRIIWFGNV